MSLAKKSVHGSVYKISADEYLKEVNEASKTGPVFLHLTSSTTINDASKRLSELWREAAKEYGEIKFCEMQDRQLPEQMTPTILVYKDDEIVKRIVTLDTMGGMRVNMRHIDDLLVEVGAVQDTDMRVLKRRQQAREAEEEGYREGRTSIRTGVTSKRSKVDDDDDDWD